LGAGFNSDTLRGSNVTLAIYTYAVEEDDRLVAGQLGEMLCPNAAKLAQEKTFAESEGMVFQYVALVAGGGFEPPTFGL
jgi:hypothetical protein